MVYSTFSQSYQLIGVAILALLEMHEHDERIPLIGFRPSFSKTVNQSRMSAQVFFSCCIQSLSTNKIIQSIIVFLAIMKVEPRQFMEMQNTNKIIHSFVIRQFRECDRNLLTYCRVIMQEKHNSKQTSSKQG